MTACEAWATIGQEDGGRGVWGGELSRSEYLCASINERSGVSADVLERGLWLQRDAECTGGVSPGRAASFLMGLCGAPVGGSGERLGN